MPVEQPGFRSGAVVPDLVRYHQLPHLDAGNTSAKTIAFIDVRFQA